MVDESSSSELEETLTSESEGDSGMTVEVLGAVPVCISLEVFLFRIPSEWSLDRSKTWSTDVVNVFSSVKFVF